MVGKELLVNHWLERSKSMAGKELINGWKEVNQWLERSESMIIPPFDAVRLYARENDNYPFTNLSLSLSGPPILASKEKSHSTFSLCAATWVKSE